MRLLITAFLFSAVFEGQTSVPSALDVRQGTASFEVATNMPAMTVHGKSQQLRAKIQMRQGPRQVVLETIEARVDPRSLSTGIELRDQHMREKVLTARDGTLPELRFAAKRAACPMEEAGKAVTCQVQGTFFVRGVGKPFVILLKLKPDEKQGSSFRVSGDGIRKLSDYGVEAPAHLGVRVADEVKVRVEFVAKSHGEVT